MIDNVNQQHVFIHIHVPKCAGTSINSLLGKRFPGRALAYSNPDDFCLFQELTPSQRSKRFSAVFGHLKYGVHEQFNSECVYFSALRNPLSRICSYYNYIQLTPAHPDHALFKTKYPTIDHITEKEINKTPCLKNNLSNYACSAYSGYADISDENWPLVIGQIEASVESGHMWLGNLSSTLGFLVKSGIVSERESIPKHNVTNALNNKTLNFELADVKTLECQTRAMLIDLNRFDLQIFDRWCSDS